MTIKDQSIMQAILQDMRVSVDFIEENQLWDSLWLLEKE